MSVRKEVNKYVSQQMTIFSMPFSIGLTGSSSGHDMDAGLVPEDSADMVLTAESEGVAANSGILADGEMGGGGIRRVERGGRVEK